MAFDPFAPGQKLASDGGEGGDEGGDEKPPKAPEGGQDTQPGGESTTPPPAKPEGAPEGEGEDQKKAQLQSLQGEIQRLLSGKPKAQAAPAEATPAPQPQPAPQPTPQKDGQTQEAPGYNIAVSDDVIEAIGSGDNKMVKAALNGLVNGIMNKIAVDFRQALEHHVKELKKEIPAIAKETASVEQTSKSIKEDFYQAFPTFKGKHWEGPVWQTAAALGQAKGYTEWNEEFRDTLGELLHSMYQVPKPTTPAAAEPTGKPPRKTFAAGNSGGGGGAPRPGANGAADPVKEFTDVLNAGT